MGRQILALVGWVLLCFAAAAFGGLFMPGEWYASLKKPTWNPPGWVFGPVWTALYTLMAVAAWLVWKRGGWSAQRRPLALFIVQLALNAAWTPLFFGLHRPDLAFAEIKEIVRAVQSDLKEATRGNAIRWTPPAHIHLTLRFLGNVAADPVEALVARLREASEGIAPFDLEVGKVGAFPSTTRPRVLWLGLGETWSRCAFFKTGFQGIQPLGVRARSGSFIPISRWRV